MTEHDDELIDRHYEAFVREFVAPNRRPRYLNLYKKRRAHRGLREGSFQEAPWCRHIIDSLREDRIVARIRYRRDDLALNDELSAALSSSCVIICGPTFEQPVDRQTAVETLVTFGNDVVVSAVAGVRAVVKHHDEDAYLVLGVRSYHVGL